MVVDGYTHPVGSDGAKLDSSKMNNHQKRDEKITIDREKYC